MKRKQGWRTDLDREMEGSFQRMPVIDQRSGTVTRPTQKRSRSLFDEMESMPEGNYQQSYERRGGPRVGAEGMFQQMDRGMLGGPPQDMPLPMLQATPDERRLLQEKEQRFYEEHPQSTLELSPTEWTTPFNMPLYQDQHGVYHSESSSTGPTPDGKWMTHGMIWPDQETGKPRYFTEDEARDLIIKNNFVNPVSQEEIPLFETEDEAIQYAVDRDLILNDRKYPWNQ